jgi:hypothetical protein
MTWFNCRWLNPAFPSNASGLEISSGGTLMTRLPSRLVLLELRDCGGHSVAHLEIADRECVNIDLVDFVRDGRYSNCDIFAISSHGETVKCSVKSLLTRRAKSTE